ncbi:MAG: YihY/virulence factor BrkB family protein [Archangium sp.]|nr:YihY/virulence factor BrkB family protein [Archangium sp.]
MTTLRSTFQQSKRLLGETLRRWLEDDISTHAASLAYYTVFSIAPTLIIAVAVAGAIFGPEAARGEVRTQIDGLVGSAGATVIEDMMVNASKPGAGALASIIGGVVLLFGATGVFAALQTALNHIWAAPKPKRSAVKSFLRTRFLSLAMVLGIGFLLLVSLVVSALISALGHLFGSDVTQITLQVVNFVLSFAFVTVLFALIYKLLPDVRVAWGDVWLGAAVTAALFNLGKALISLYLGGGAVASSYGATGSLAVLLIWIYYSAMVLFLGAEFTHVYARQLGSLRDAPAEKTPDDGTQPHHNFAATPG